MKKLRLIVAMLLVALSTMAIGTVLAACNVQFGENCDHEYEWVVKTPATCTAEGLEVQKCKKCQEEGETRKLDKIAHEYEWVETLAPTCIAKGSEHQVCKNCQAEGETREKDMVAHTPDLEKGYQIDEEAGTHAYECKVCGEPVEAEAHKKSETAKIDAEKNVHYYECTVCHARMDEGAHTYEFKTTQEATCANAGSKTEYCTVCNAEGKTETINPLDHTPDLTTVKSDETGHWNECSVCHGKVNFASHTPAGAYHYNGEEEENTHYQVCTYEGCGYHVVEDCTPDGYTVALQHDAGTNTHYSLCTHCNGGRLNETQCTLGDWQYRDADAGSDSATKTVHYKSCSECKAEYDVGGHTIVWITIKEPSCSEEGIKVGYCTTCFHPIPAENRTDTAAIEAFCKEKYSSTVYFSHSGDFYAVIEKTAHTPELTWTGGENGHYHKCSVCNQPADEPVPHDATGQPWKSDAGSHWHECKDCGYHIDITAHEYDQEDGKKCVCGAEKPSEYITNIEDYTIEADGDTGNYKITKYNGDDAMIQLPTNYLEGKIVKIAASAFTGNTSLTHVIIPEGYTTILDKAFYTCTELAAIELPAGLKTIGARVFYGCTHLITANIPTSVNEFGSFAFYNCPLQMTLTFGDNEEHTIFVGEQTFAGTNIKTIIFSEGITAFKAFTGNTPSTGFLAGMNELTTVVLPSTLETLYTLLFPKPTTATKLKPATTTYYTAPLANLKYLCLNAAKDQWEGKTINMSAPGDSNGNSGLLSLPLYYLGDGVEEGTFKIADNTVTVADWAGDSGLLFYRSVAASGTTYNLLGGESWTVIGYSGEADVAVVIPDTYAGLPVAAIEPKAFSGKSFSALTFGKNITTLPANALFNLTIPAIDIPASITLVASSLANCKMTTVTLSVSEIPASCFNGCSALTAFDFTGVTTIGANAFNGCSALQEVFLPTTVTTIGSQAFYGCGSLKHVVFNEGLTQLPEKGLRSSLTSLEWVVIPSTITGASAFGGTSGTTWVFGTSSPTQPKIYFGGDKATWNALLANNGINSTLVAKLDHETDAGTENGSVFSTAKNNLFFYASENPGDDTVSQTWHWKDDSAKTEPEKWSDVAAASVNALPVALDLTHSGKDLFSKNLY